MILKRKTKLALYRFGIICNFLFLVVSIPEALILNGELTQNNIIIGSLNYVWKSTCIISVLLLYYNLWLCGRICPAFFPPLLFLNVLANPIISIIFIYNGVLLQRRVLKRRTKFHLADSRKTAFFRLCLSRVYVAEHRLLYSRHLPVYNSFPVWFGHRQFNLGLCGNILSLFSDRLFNIPYMESHYRHNQGEQYQELLYPYFLRDILQPVLLL